LSEGILLESHDSLSKSSRQIDLYMEVWDDGEDGLNFSIPGDAGVCLRKSGDTNTGVYVGAGATRVSLPLDLTGNGACGTNTTTVSAPLPTAAPAADGRKYNRGHYIAMVKWDTDDHPAIIDSIKPGVVGFHKRYYWSDLEPSYGNYDFSQVQRDLNLLAGQGLQLVILIEDRTFKNVRATPAYLWDTYTLRNRTNGYTSARWDPYVVSRYNALTRAMGERFDAHPNFEGIAIQESSLGLDKAVREAAGYTPAKYRDALIDMLSSASQSFPTSRVFWYMNFLVGKQAYIADVAEAVAPHGVVMGGPDVLPDESSLVNQTYPFYSQFRDKMPLFGGMQFDSYRHLHVDTSYPTKYWTMGEQFRYARDKLHVNYIFWTRKPGRWPEGSYNWLDALPVIANNPAFNY
jgi:hypothetical protein